MNGEIINLDENINPKSIRVARNERVMSPIVDRWMDNNINSNAR